MFFIGLLVLAGFRARRPRKAVEYGPADQPYRVYTRDFDRVLNAEDVFANLSKLSFDSAKGHFDFGRGSWNRAADLALQLYEGAISQFESHSNAWPDDLSGTAVVFLVDQSGSMKGENMASTAAAMRLATEDLVRRHAMVEVLGFSTAGWHGGFVRLKWINDRRPSRPGRLCALLHIVYKAADAARLEHENWRAMLNPNLLRENVDGEALEWAVSRTKSIAARQKILVVVSDGAPVDDSTLMENGPSYLHRHIRKTIAETRAEGAVTLAALGVGYDVSSYYGDEFSHTANRTEDLPEAIGDLLTGLLRTENTPG